MNIGPRAATAAPQPRSALRRARRAVPGVDASADVIFILMRRMRFPLVVLISIFAIDVFGLTLMPGTDPTGAPHHLSIFDAF